MSVELEAEIELLVPFFDADPMGIVWHGNYAKYFELARSALFDRFNFGYMEMANSGYYWPIVELRLKYVKSARFDQKIRASASLREFENRIRIDYLIRDADSGDRLCKGHTIQVAVDQKTGEMSFQSPKILLARLGQAE